MPNLAENLHPQFNDDDVSLLWEAMGISPEELEDMKEEHDRLKLLEKARINLELLRRGCKRAEWKSGRCNKGTKNCIVDHDEDATRE